MAERRLRPREVIDSSTGQWKRYATIENFHETRDTSRQIDVGKWLELLVRDFVVTNTGLSPAQATTLMSSTRSPARATDLSARECDVLKLLAKGVTTTAVAETLQISRTTVNNHVQHILRKLDSHTRLGAIRRAEHAGLI